MAAAGWSTSQLAACAGVSRNAVAQLRTTGQGRVLPTAAAAITALYEDCWWRTPPGADRDHARTETWARKHAWIPAWRWDGVDLDDPSAEPLPEQVDMDEVAIAETISGRPVPLTKTERHFVVDELHSRGRLGRCPRTVERYLARGRAAGQRQDVA